MANRIAPPADSSRTDLGSHHTVAHMKANPGVRANVRSRADFILAQVEFGGTWEFSNGLNWRAQKNTVTAVRWLEANSKIVRTGGPDYCPTFRAA